MGDTIDNGLGWLVEKLKVYASRPVVYRRGADEVTVNAIIGKTITETMDVDETQLSYTSRRFLVHPTDLDFGAGPVTPQRGDQIRVTMPNGQTAIYEVTGHPPAQLKLDRLLEIVANYMKIE